MWYKTSQSGERKFPYIHNPEKSPYFGDEYGQDIEPSGKYVTEYHKAPDGWESGEMHFKNPLYIPFGGGYKEPSNWKKVLAKKYGVTGINLSKAIINDGYDGIITLEEDGVTPSEIIDLSVIMNSVPSESDGETESS